MFSIHTNQYTISFFQALAKSDLPLRIIELQHFPYCKAFEDLLKAKGHGLHELLFRAINSLNSKHILYIGKHCKALQRLHIKELGPEEDQTMVLMTASKLKFIYSEKATKFCKISTDYLTDSTLDK